MFRAHRLPLPIAGLVLAAALLVGGCGSSAPKASDPTNAPTASPTTALGAAATSAPQPTSHMITIHDFSFGSPITVPAGATVTVRNSDSTTHSLSSDDGSFDAGNVPPGHRVTFVAPSRPGTFEFHCNFHADMHGTLTVVS